jgi:hypothetical protein
LVPNRDTEWFAEERKIIEQAFVEIAPVLEAFPR